MPDVAATDETRERRPPGEEPGAGAGARRAGVPGWQQFIAKYGVLVALVVTIIVFSALKPHVFPTGSNLKAILEQFSPLAIIGFGLTVVLVMGDFDLSVAGMIGLGSAVVVSLMSKHGVNYLLAILIGLLVGVAGGAVNGVLVAFAGASSFIITLAMGQVFNGFEYLITKQETIFQGIPNAYTQIATGTFLGLSNQFFIMLGVLVIIYLLLEQSTIGRFMYALGGNQEAARLSGIRVRELRTLGFMIIGVCSVDRRDPDHFPERLPATELGNAVLPTGVRLGVPRLRGAAAGAVQRPRNARRRLLPRGDLVRADRAVAVDVGDPARPGRDPGRRGAPLPSRSRGDMSGEPLVSIRGLVKQYPGVLAVDGATFDIPREQIVGLVGKNGAGKSTVIKILAGAVQPDAGEILVDGRPVIGPRSAAGRGLRLRVHAPGARAVPADVGGRERDDGLEPSPPRRGARQLAQHVRTGADHAGGPGPDDRPAAADRPPVDRPEAHRDDRAGAACAGAPARP